MAAGAGFEPDAGVLGIKEKREATHKETHKETGAADPDWVRMAERWPSLPAAVRGAILAIVESVAEGKEGVQ